MAGASAFTDSAPLLLFQNLREGMQNGRITDLNAALTELDVAITKLSSEHLPEQPTHFNDLVAKLLLECELLKERVTKCEEQIADKVNLPNEDATWVIARKETTGFLTEYQKKKPIKALPAYEEMRASKFTAPQLFADPAPSSAEPLGAYAPLHAHPDHSSCPIVPFTTLLPSPVDSAPCPAPSRVATISFPGGARTVTIHPPDSPSYQPVIRDGNGDVIIDFRRTKPLRREGAFRGPIEEVDWREIARVWGRGGPEPSVAQTMPTNSRWPDGSHASYHTPARGPGHITPKQRRPWPTARVDTFGHVRSPEHPLFTARSPSLPTGMFSSLPPSSQVFQFSSSTADLDSGPILPSSPPSPTDGRSRKRSRSSDHDAVSTMYGAGCDDPASQTVKEPITPTSARRGEFCPPEGPTKCKKLRLSVSSEGLSAAATSRPVGTLDLTRTV